MVQVCQVCHGSGLVCLDLDQNSTVKCPHCKGKGLLDDGFLKKVETSNELVPKIHNKLTKRKR